MSHPLVTVSSGCLSLGVCVCVCAPACHWMSHSDWSKLRVTAVLSACHRWGFSIGTLDKAKSNHTMLICTSINGLTLLSCGERDGPSFLWIGPKCARPTSKWVAGTAANPWRSPSPLNKRLLRGSTYNCKNIDHQIKAHLHEGSTALMEMQIPAVRGGFAESISFKPD